MHGLKCAGAFPGWTRLCDEWLGSLSRPWTYDGSTPWEHPGLPVRTVAAAASRTRAFASGGAEEPVEADAAGILRFELQGVEYVVDTAEWSPEDDAEMLPGARARLEALLAGAKAAALAEEHPVALLVLSPRRRGADTPASRPTVERWVDAFRGADLTHAMAYFFPPPGSEDARHASAEWPGAFLLARSAVFG